MDKLTKIRNLVIQINGNNSAFYPTNNISLDINKGQIYGIVGESGSGKTVTFTSLMGVDYLNPGILSGEIEYSINGEKINFLKELPKYININNGTINKNSNKWQKMLHKDTKGIRGRLVSFVPQEASSALNPYFTCKKQLLEAAKIALPEIKKEEYQHRIEMLLHQVRCNNVHTILHSYPHQLSGGLCQRVAIAMALLGDPQLLIADEPTTGLDKIIQSDLIELFKHISNAKKVTIILISHDLSFLAKLADNIVVMYAGRVVEEYSSEDIFNSNLKHHPYTEELLESHGLKDSNNDRMFFADIPDLEQLPTGCAYHSRCKYYNNKNNSKLQNVCNSITPELKKNGNKHSSACIRYII